MIGNDWDNELSVIWNSPGFHKFMNIVNNEYDTKIIYPPKEDIFAALKNTSFKDVKVVIVGQDPYHGEGEAMGLSFSVHKGIKLPPSLKNIYQEMYDDLGIKPVTSGDLTKWTKEGVLLLNATLTVVKDTPNSHSKIGWDKFTDYVIKKINTKEEPVVFILWGNFARSKKAFITNPKHLVIESAHPSPFSARNGFFGSKPFSKTNEFLTKNNIKPIDWDLSK
jgi:uracil-DNA glycosylase